MFFTTRDEYVVGIRRKQRIALYEYTAGTNVNYFNAGEHSITMST